MDSFQGTKLESSKKSKKKKKSAEALVVPEPEIPISILEQQQVEPQNDIVIEDSEDNAMDLVVEEQVNNTIFYTTTSKLLKSFFLHLNYLRMHIKLYFKKATMTSLHYKY